MGSGLRLDIQKDRKNEKSIGLGLINQKSKTERVSGWIWTNKERL